MSSDRALGPSAAYPSDAARALLTAYLEEKADAALPASAGRLTELLWPGKAVAKFTLCLRGFGERPLAVVSNSLELDVAPPAIESLDAKAREAFVARLLDQFDRDAWAAEQAHDTAVRIGKDLLPRLIAAAEDQRRPGFSRMWLATALADIRDPSAAEALVRLLADRSQGVRRVAAYHGPKQADAGLDEAIIRSAAGSSDGGLVALALLGFLVFRGTAPEAIVKAGLDSDEPRARAAATEALATRRNHLTVERLAALLKDKDERVRRTAAAVLGRMDARAPNVIGALVAALDLPGESARQEIAKTLCGMTGQEWPYDPRADESARRETINAWKAWWAAEKRNPG